LKAKQKEMKNNEKKDIKINMQQTNMNKYKKQLPNKQQSKKHRRPNPYLQALLFYVSVFYQQANQIKDLQTL
jgi:hypothetical protein